MSIRANEILCETFSLRLATVRKARGMSQQDVGELAGLHPSHISCMESGKRHPMLETVYRLTTALKCSSDYLLGLSDSLEGGSVPKDAYEELLTENETLRQIIRDAMKENTVVG